MAAKPKPRKPKGESPHKRTALNVRILQAMVKANPAVAHQLLWEAIGVSSATLYRHYADVIPHPGAGRPEHVPTQASRVMVEQHRGLGLKHEEIAHLMGIDRTTLEKHYAVELGAAKARIVGKVGSIMITRALSKNDKDSQRAGEFLLERVGGLVSRKATDEPPGDEGPALVGPSRVDARKVALLLFHAQRTTVVSSKPAPPADEEPAL